MYKAVKTYSHVLLRWTREKNARATTLIIILKKLCILAFIFFRIVMYLSVFVVVNFGGAVRRLGRLGSLDSIDSTLRLTSKLIRPILGRFDSLDSVCKAQLEVGTTNWSVLDYFSPNKWEFTFLCGATGHTDRGKEGVKETWSKRRVGIRFSLQHNSNWFLVLHAILYAHQIIKQCLKALRSWKNGPCKQPN